MADTVDIPAVKHPQLIQYLEEGYSLPDIERWLDKGTPPMKKTAAKYSSFYIVFSETAITLALGGTSAQLEREQKTVFSQAGALEVRWLFSLLRMVDKVKEDFYQTKDLKLRMLVDLTIAEYSALGEEELKMKVLASTPTIFHPIINKAFQLPEPVQGASAEA